MLNIGPSQVSFCGWTKERENRNKNNALTTMLLLISTISKGSVVQAFCLFCWISPKTPQTVLNSKWLSNSSVWSSVNKLNSFKTTEILAETFVDIACFSYVHLIMIWFDIVRNILLFTMWQNLEFTVILLRYTCVWVSQWQFKACIQKYRWPVILCDGDK